MKEGRSLTDLAKEIERQSKVKKDYIADTTSLEFKSNGSSMLEIAGHGEFGITETCHGQIASRLKIPKLYYDRMKEQAPNLLQENVNTWLQMNPEKRMIRTLDNKARAFLSDRYRRIDNAEIAETVLPVLGELPSLEIGSCEITENRMYLKAIIPSVSAEIAYSTIGRVGDVVQAGIVISNSEIGFGSLSIEPMVYTLACKNGMISKDHAMKKYHVGRRVGMDDATYELFSDETMKQDDLTLMMKVKDLVRACADQVKFKLIVAKLQEATEKIITGNPVKSVEVLANRVNLNNEEKDSVLTHLIQGKNLSMYGLSSAVTRTSQDISSYDRATDLERIGGQIIELNPHDWKVIAEAK